MTKIYRDVDLNFTKHPVTGDVSKLIGDEAVKQSLKNLVLTRFFERAFDPEKGCGVHTLLFDNITPITTITIENTIRDVINNYEPRVELISVVATPVPDQHKYDVTILFTILNQPEPVQLNVVLTRMR